MHETNHPMPGGAGEKVLVHGKFVDKEALAKSADMPAFWNWELLYVCNYRCSYCPFTQNGWETFYDKNAFPGLARLTQVWERIHALYGKCHIAMSGGEPAVYPDFIALMRMLTRWHSTELNTNLSFDVERFAASVDLSRVRIGASFHPQFTDFEGFFRRASYLKERGVEVFVNYVSYPEQLPKLREYRRAFKDAHMPFHIMPFQGDYNGKPYPASATPEEKALLESALEDVDPEVILARRRMEWEGHAIQRDPQPPAPPAPAPPAAPAPAPAQIAAPALELPIKAHKEPVLCRMGQKYAKVRPNGDVYRCCAKTPKDWVPAKPIYLGNLFLDDDLKLLEEPAWCDYSPCPCDRCMVVGQEERWESRWVTAKG